MAGTWRVIGGTDASAGLVLAKVPDGYQGFIFVESAPVIARSRSSGSRGQLPRQPLDDEARQRATEQHRKRRARWPSIIALVAIAAVAVLIAQFAIHRL